MSFAESVREELAELPIKHTCCRRALTDGLLLAARETADRRITVRYRSEIVATLASAMIRAQYGNAPDSEMVGLCGHRYYDLLFSSPACRKFLRALENASTEALHFQCDGCRAAFLRGVFLAVGTLNDPHRSYHMEFSMPSEATAAILIAVLQEIGHTPRRIARKNAIGVYFKEGAALEDLVGLMGSPQLVFDIFNSRIEREIRNNENRATNCVAKNIEKSISAATRQVEAIGRLMEHGRFERLPEGVRTTALVRYRNPDVTLDELVALHDPPISKSGLNHRLKKILEAAEEL